MSFRVNYKLLIFMTLVCFSSAVIGEENSAEPGRILTGEELFVACGFCHGAQGQGGPALDAPALAGMEAWYVERQLHAFRDRQRGMHPEDVPGLQMSIVSGMARNDSTIKNLAAYIEAMPTDGPPEKARDGSIAGTERPFIWRSKYAKLTPPKPANVTAGGAIYKATCLVCHGPNAEGNQALGAPKLTLTPAWYQHRQLQYYRDGLRGVNTSNVYDLQMAAFGKLLTDDQQIADVVAYIKSIGADE